jgi:hypothetical protein
MDHTIPYMLYQKPFRQLENLHVAMPAIAQSHFRGMRVGDH